MEDKLTENIDNLENTNDLESSDATENKNCLDSVNEKSSKKKRKSKKKGVKGLIIELSVKIGLTALTIWILLTFVVGVFINHGNSSYPMIKDGDLCITSLQSEVTKNEVVAFETDKGTKFARIVALAGDTVTISDGYVVVNGYTIENAVYETTPAENGIEYPYIVPEGSVFLLNDYRSDTNDSRVLGAIPLDKTKGKVIFIMRKRGM